MLFNDEKEKMHPEDKRNFVIFIVLSLMIWVSFDHFILKPKYEKLQAAREAELAQSAQESPDLDSSVPEDDGKKYPREEALAWSPRIDIRNDAVSGSIALRGGRIDDLSLLRYSRTLDSSEKFPLLSPARSEHPKYIEFGWVASEGSSKLPDKDSLWQVSAGKTLSPGAPVTLYWDNGQGLRFERTIEIDDNYMMTVTRRVTNNGGSRAVLFPYALVAEQDLPEDFSGVMIVQEGPMGYIGGELHEHPYVKMPKKPVQELKASTGWTGISEKYWFTGLIPEQQDMKTFRFIYTPPKGKDGRHKYQADYVGSAKSVAPGESAETVTRVFAGAKETGLLAAYEKSLPIHHFDLVVDFGLYYFLTKPFYYVLEFLGRMTGSFGMAIILLTIVVRLAVFPLANTSYKSFARLKQIAPHMKDLRDKFGDDKEKLQAELVKLYEREKVNPMAGCFPILLQIPIFFALYKVLSLAIEMRHAPFFGWVHDLSARDPTSVFNLFGLLAWQPPEFMMIGGWSCIMLVAMLVQKRMNPPPQDPTQAMMINYMPYFITYILSKFAVGLVIYWTLSNILSVAQQYIIMRRMGVEVHLFKRDRTDKEMEEMVTEGPKVHPELEVVEDQVEEALFGEDDGGKTSVSPPKRRRGGKKK